MFSFSSATDISGYMRTQTRTQTSSHQEPGSLTVPHVPLLSHVLERGALDIPGSTPGMQRGSPKRKSKDLYPEMGRAQKILNIHLFKRTCNFFFISFCIKLKKTPITYISVLFIGSFYIAYSKQCIQPKNNSVHVFTRLQIQACPESGSHLLTINHRNKCVYQGLNEG